jgi:sulfur relay protein TusB/DsrH
VARYFFIESRDPFDSSDSQYFFELVEGVSSRENEVTLFLVQNGVLPLRNGSKHSNSIAKLLNNGIKILADNFSLRERAINKPLDGVEVADMDRFVDLLLEPGSKAIWH